MTKSNGPDDYKKIDIVIDTVTPQVVKSIDDANQMNDQINQKYLNALDKSLEIFKFHKTTNYILVGLGIILISFGLIHGTIIEFLTNNDPGATTQQQGNQNQVNGSLEEEGQLGATTKQSAVTNVSTTGSGSTNNNKVDLPQSQWISLLSGGSGLALLVSSFFYKSQIYAQESVTNLAITNMVFKSHYTNHLITRIAAQLRLIDVKRNWPEMSKDIDILPSLPETVQEEIENLRKKQQQGSLHEKDLENLLTRMKATGNNNNNADVSTAGSGGTNNNNADVLSSFENLINIMTIQTKIHAELLKNLSTMERK